jgi:6,7-dimethyl-8-ribityllumazine synthase
MMAMNASEGKLNAASMRFALVVGRFNSALGDKLVDGAMDCLTRHGAAREDVSVVRVPGAWELPQAARRLAGSGKFDAVVALAVIVRGATPHFDLLAAEATRALGQAAAGADLPVTFGLVTADTLEQALERCGTKSGNKGWDAAMAAIEMVDLFRQIES